MQTIRIHEDVEADLITLCGKVQIVKNKRTSPSAAISLLLRFMKQHLAEFDVLILKEKEFGFTNQYNEKIASMRNSGLPTTKDLSV